ncbi:MAG: hypothetical protein H6807_06035 [Planctomycetes bacterium]|nr:hypothetical protein [Planctomycetota bacterium]
MRSTLLLLLGALTLGFVLGTPLKAQPGDDAELEKRVEATDFTDPEALYELASWAIGNKSSAKIRGKGRDWMKEVIDMDPDHAGAREALGHVKVGDEWYTDKKEAAKARKKAMEAKMEAQGYVWFKNGWIKKTAKRDWNSKWEKNDEDVWLSYEEVMSAKGYTLYKGEWLRMNDEDRKAIEYHRKHTGEDILVVSTPHFRMHTSIPVKFVQQYCELIEKVYDWYMETLQVEENYRGQFFGGVVDVWTFETSQQFQDWVTLYQETYAFTDEEKKDFRERPGGHLIPHKHLWVIVREDAKDVENPLLHYFGYSAMLYQTHGRYAEWEAEGMGHLIEELFSGEKNGIVSLSTRSRYANSGGIAGKEFNTKDARPQTRGIVKAGDDISISELSKQTLNSLNQDHLAQGFSIIEYLYSTRLADLIGVIKAQRASKGQDPVQIVNEGIQNGTQKSTADLERDWREYVKNNYKPARSS